MVYWWKLVTDNWYTVQMFYTCNVHVGKHLYSTRSPYNVWKSFLHLILFHCRIPLLPFNLVCPKHNIVVILLHKNELASMQFSSRIERKTIIELVRGEQLCTYCFSLSFLFFFPGIGLSLIHIWRCRRYSLCRSRWSPYH